MKLTLELNAKLEINYFLKFKMELETRFLIPPIALSSILAPLHIDSVPFTHPAKHLPHLHMTNHALMSFDIQISFCDLRLISTSKWMKLKIHCTLPKWSKTCCLKLPSPGLTTLTNCINTIKVLQLNKSAVRLEKIKFLLLFMCGKESRNLFLWLEKNMTRTVAYLMLTCS